MKRFVIAVLIVGVVLVAARANTDPTEGADEQRAELVAEMAEMLDRALYLAIAALSWPDRDDLTLYVQGIINLLDGPSSPDYDDSGGAATPDGEGLKDLYLALQTLGSTIAGTEPTYLRPSLAVQAAQALEHTEMYLFLAAEAAKAALDRMYSISRGEQELRAVYAYLLAARGRTDDELVLGGLQTLVDLFPSREIWVESEPSIQAAIDRAPAGATIHLDPGTYREKLVIDKDLTLVGAPRPEGSAGSPGTAIAGAAWDFVVTIEGDGVEVRLENLTLVGGTVAVAVSGDNAAHLDRVWIETANTGLSAYDGASVSCDKCSFGGLKVGMILRSGADVRVANSTIQDGNIHLFAGSSLTMTDTTVSECDSHAVSLQGDAALHLERCSIYDNEGFGVFAYTAECDPHFIGVPDPDYAFTGTITGADNTIPGPEEDHGNLAGDVCPEVYRFLKGDGPIIVPPDESE